MFVANARPYNNSMRSSPEHGGARLSRRRLLIAGMGAAALALGLPGWLFGKGAIDYERQREEAVRMQKFRDIASSLGGAIGLNQTDTNVGAPLGLVAGDFGPVPYADGLRQTVQSGLYTNRLDRFKATYAAAQGLVTYHQAEIISDSRISLVSFSRREQQTFAEILAYAGSTTDADTPETYRYLSYADTLYGPAVSGRVVSETIRQGTKQLTGPPIQLFLMELDIGAQGLLAS